MYGMIVDARLSEHKGNLVAAMLDVDVELGLRERWTGPALTPEQRAASLRGNVIRVPAGR